MDFKIKAWNRLDKVMYDWDSVKKDLSFYLESGNQHIELVMKLPFNDRNEDDIFQKDILFSIHSRDLFIVDWDPEKGCYSLFKDGEACEFQDHFVDVISDFVVVGSSYNHPYLSEVI